MDPAKGVRILLGLQPREGGVNLQRHRGRLASLARRQEGREEGGEEAGVECG